MAHLYADIGKFLVGGGKGPDVEYYRNGWWASPEIWRGGLMGFDLTSQIRIGAVFHFYSCQVQYRPWTLSRTLSLTLSDIGSGLVTPVKLPTLPRVPFRKTIGNVKEADLNNPLCTL